MTAKRDVKQRMVAMTDLDPRVNGEIRMELRDNVTEYPLSGGMTEEEAGRMEEVFVDNKDLFT